MVRSITFDWQWNGNRESFKLILKFYPDMGHEDNVWLFDEKFHVVTWCPAHLEQGYLGELLTLANAINGMSLRKRRLMKPEIDRYAGMNLEHPLTEENVINIRESYKRIQNGE